MEDYRLGTRQRPLQAWQELCIWIRAVQKIRAVVVPLRKYTVT